MVPHSGHRILLKNTKKNLNVLTNQKLQIADGSHRGSGICTVQTAKLAVALIPERAMVLPQQTAAQSAT